MHSGCSLGVRTPAGWWEVQRDNAAKSGTLSVDDMAEVSKVGAAWVPVDEQDEPAVLDTYIAYAFQCAAAGSRGRGSPG